LVIHKLKRQLSSLNSEDGKSGSRSYFKKKDKKSMLLV
jgi:hypothetical protein